jgi:hypothetical protein
MPTKPAIDGYPARQKTQRLAEKRLAAELAKLDKAQERSFAEEGMGLEHDSWPIY